MNQNGYNYYLCHHGILGQRWGRKNGPPYPLGSSDHSASEKKAGWRKSLDKPSESSHTKSSNTSKDSGDSGKDGFHLTDKQKKAIKIGAAAVAASLAAYGTYQLAKSGKLNELAVIGKARVDAILGEKAGDTTFGQQKASDLLGHNVAQKAVTETVGGIKKLAKPESLSETLKNANPHRGNSAYDNNCTLCSITAFLRQRGYDVTAGKTGRMQQSVVEKVNECFKGAKTTTGSAVKFGRSRKDAAEMLVRKYGQNAEGVCSIQWKSRPGGHAFNWKIKNGIVSFFDSQSGRADDYVSRIYWKDINPGGGLELARLDGAEINFDGIKTLLE